MTEPRTTNVGSCAFSCEDFALVSLEISSHVAQRSSSRTSATNITFLSTVGALGFPSLGSLSMLTQPQRKRLAERELVLLSIVN